MALTWDKISSTTVTGTPNYIEFNSIPNTYTDLILMGKSGSVGNDTQAYSQKTVANSTTIPTNIQGMFARSTINGFGAESQNFIYYDYNITTGDNITSVGMQYILNYTNDKFKTILTRNGKAFLAATYSGSEQMVSIWRNTGVISSLQVRVQPDASITWRAGTVLTLYGIKRKV